MEGGGVASRTDRHDSSGAGGAERRRADQQSVPALYVTAVPEGVLSRQESSTHAFSAQYAFLKEMEIKEGVEDTERVVEAKEKVQRL